LGTKVKVIDLVRVSKGYFRSVVQRDTLQATLPALYLLARR